MTIDGPIRQLRLDVVGKCRKEITSPEWDLLPNLAAFRSAEAVAVAVPADAHDLCALDLSSCDDSSCILQPAAPASLHSTSLDPTELRFWSATARPFPSCAFRL